MSAIRGSVAFALAATCWTLSRAHPCRRLLRRGRRRRRQSRPRARRRRDHRADLARGLLHQRAIGIAMAAAAPRFLPEPERHSGQFNVPGAIASTLGMTALVYG